MKEDVSFTDYALCFNCKYLDEENKCEIQNKTKEAQQTCGFFEGKPQQLTYKEHLTRKRDEIKRNKEVDKTKYPTTDLKQRLADGVPKITWRVQDIMLEKGVTIFGGPSGCRKTFLGMQLALSVSTGKDFLQQYNTKKASVLYIDEENGDITLPSRFDALITGSEITKEDFSNIHLSIFNNIKLDEHLSSEVLLHLINRTKAEVVILDSLVRLMVGEEDKSSDVRKIFETLKIVMERIDRPVSFLILHHTVKNSRAGINSLRGSGDFAAFADIVYMFDGKTDYSVVSCEKNRHLDRSILEPFIIRINKSDNSNGLNISWSALSKCDDLIGVCADEIKDWASINSIRTIKTNSVLSEFEPRYKRNTLFSALSRLVDDKLMVKLKRGIYRFDNDLKEETILDS
jgi:hypothetical protein